MLILITDDILFTLFEIKSKRNADDSNLLSLDSSLPLFGQLLC